MLYKDAKHSFSLVKIVHSHAQAASLARGVVLLKTLLLRIREMLGIFDLTDRDALMSAFVVNGFDSQYIVSSDH